MEYKSGAGFSVRKDSIESEEIDDNFEDIESDELLCQIWSCYQQQNNEMLLQVLVDLNNRVYYGQMGTFNREYAINVRQILIELANIRNQGVLSGICLQILGNICLKRDYNDIFRVHDGFTIDMIVALLQSNDVSFDTFFFVLQFALFYDNLSQIVEIFDIRRLETLLSRELSIQKVHTVCRYLYATSENELYDPSSITSCIEAVLACQNYQLCQEYILCTCLKVLKRNPECLITNPTIMNFCMSSLESHDSVIQKHSLIFFHSVFNNEIVLKDFPLHIILNICETGSINLAEIAIKCIQTLSCIKEYALILYQSKVFDIISDIINYGQFKLKLPASLVLSNFLMSIPEEIVESYGALVHDIIISMSISNHSSHLVSAFHLFLSNIPIIKRKYFLNDFIHQNGLEIIQECENHSLIENLYLEIKDL